MDTELSQYKILNNLFLSDMNTILPDNELYYQKNKLFGPKQNMFLCKVLQRERKGQILPSSLYVTLESSVHSRGPNYHSFLAVLLVLLVTFIHTYSEI